MSQRFTNVFIIGACATVIANAGVGLFHKVRPRFYTVNTRDRGGSPYIIKIEMPFWTWSTTEAIIAVSPTGHTIGAVKRVD